MENTSYISDISYMIENWLYQGKSIAQIEALINDRKNSGQFPANLNLVNAFYDKGSGTSGCAFYDVNTGETIVGFAGTNLDNGLLESGKDLFADGIGIGVTGINPNSPFMSEANAFLNSLKEGGYTVTTATGHSLGGCLSVLVALQHGIPMTVTYNAAPVYINPLFISMLSGIMDQYAADHDGRIIQFVSSDDWLNPLSDFLGGTYLGERYTLHNGSGHDRKDFLKQDEQEYIMMILTMEKGFVEGKLGFSLDFDKDGIPDLLLDPKQLLPKNLLASPGSVGGAGMAVSVDSQSLWFLGLNLTTMRVEDLGWIHSAIAECINKNDQIKNDLEGRHDTLSAEIVSELEAASLNQLLSGINESFAKIEKKTDILATLKSFDAYSITRKFDEWGASGNRRWYADNETWSNTDFIDAVAKLKDSAFVLQHNIETTGEFDYTGRSGSKEIYTYDTLSKIGDAFVEVTNGLEPKIKKVFTGSGLREGKQDGISEALTEILQVESDNLIELQNSLDNTSQIAQGLSKNFEAMDEWIGEAIQNQGTLTTYEKTALPETYTAYLTEAEILDDVNDVLAAFDQQVEERSMELAKVLVTDYGDLLSRFNEKCSAIIDHITDFETSVKDIHGWMGKSITSKYDKVEMVNNFMENGDIDIVTPQKPKFTEIEDYHGALSSAFPSEIVEAIADAERDILPSLEIFHSTLALSETFTVRVYDLQNYLKTMVEKGVYKSMELDCIVAAQNGIGQVLNKIMFELNSLNGQLLDSSKGSAITQFTNLINEMIALMGYFGQLVEDCFGVKLEEVKPTVSSK
ncbi:hypothetical protein I6N96_09810 [Enterococcus sp. BWM-S5]|uniref:Fungal lipase-like domain-containing protein n=1 Tax=Enterococcus larvae TaxID=2794352 RepID=A0ABS4CKV5_9ENTE|nr:hypothetical protein [Enterococcus larvae]MBP1046582.1 hypothetical protein [Enterococcus larvae]